MKSWFAGHNYPAPGTTDDELPGRGRPIPVAGLACCCPAAPVVTVVMPPSAARRHPVDLLLCGHHYRASQAALLAAGATAYDSAGLLIMPGADTRPASSREPAPAGRHPVAS
ncbi:MAG: DUF7455 domain-containing protein [Streptosporangiaceae bacterium]